jgi:hypothetical protein
MYKLLLFVAYQKKGPKIDTPDYYWRNCTINIHSLVRILVVTFPSTYGINHETNGCTSQTTDRIQTYVSDVCENELLFGSEEVNTD